MSSTQRPHYSEAKTSQPQPQFRTLAGWTLFVFALAIAIAGAYLLGRSHADTEGVQILLPTPEPLLVQIVGEVHTPGLIRLQTGDRIIDAVEAAGGVTDDADIEDVNLAAFIRDGSRILIPSSKEQETKLLDTADQMQLPNSADANTAKSESVTEPENPIDLNTASKDELMSLPGIGEVKATRIIAMRLEIGSFYSLEQLLQVDGIGAQTLEGLRHRLVIK